MTIPFHASLPVSATVPVTHLVIFIGGYAKAALWSSTDYDGEPLDAKYTTYDIAPDTAQKFVDDCALFYAAHHAVIGDRSDEAGIDFWLTRNGHGAGFFDGDWGEAGDALTDAANSFGESELYVGDDEKIHHIY